jgi:aspartyl-tRNA synthetase
MYKDTACAAPRPADIGRSITVAGWVHRRRDHGSLIFIDLRDYSGLLQVVFDPSKSAEAHRVAGDLRSEWVVQVTGAVTGRLPGAENPQLPTGDVELSAQHIKVLNVARTPPFEISDEVEVDENTRMQFRFVDLRRPRMQRNLAIRHRMIKIIRDHLDERGFLEIETPILIKSTPEGARDYLVPSRLYPGHFYALPQSP